MQVAVVKYNAGNVASVVCALRRLNIEPLVTSDHAKIAESDRVIFPGVGEASSTMAHLRENGLDRLIPSLRQPVLGICLGMQLMCARSEENNTDCLAIFDEHCKLFTGTLKVPQIGWNSVQVSRGPLFNGIESDSYFYFVHSYFVELGPHVCGSTDYGQRFAAAMHKDNFYAVQFHPEKSGRVGARLLKNFIELSE